MKPVTAVQEQDNARKRTNISFRQPVLRIYFKEPPVKQQFLKIFCLNGWTTCFCQRTDTNSEENVEENLK